MLRHTLTESGDIHTYDVEWPGGIIEEGVPSSELEIKEGHKHKHGKRKSKKRKGKRKKK